jgi:outer membrane protein OmpA-like peptidoglycan-associated protein
VGLTGGLDKTGTGAEGTVKGAVVLVSTATMKRSIADVYACRKDYYDANKATIEKFTAGFIKGCEEILDLKAKKDPKYKAVLKLAVDILGKEALPTEADADGLISDALFVGIPGNNAFFKEKGNRSGFDAKLDAAALGFAESRPDFVPSDLDFDKLPGLVGGITGKANSGIASEYELDKLIYTFKISFDVDQAEFSEDTYGKDFKKAIETASLFGNAVVTIRGHTDPNKLVREFLKAGVEARLLRREGTGNASEFFTKDGKKLDFTDAKVMKTVVDMVKKEDFKDATVDPKTTLKLADKLSLDRADSVQSAVLKFAAGQKFTLDKKQIKPVGLGVTEPVVALPRTPEDAAKNRIVEFSIYSIKTKGPSAEDGVIFDF